MSFYDPILMLGIWFTGALLTDHDTRRKLYATLNSFVEVVTRRR